MKIRKAIDENDHVLSGINEADEAYIGRRAKWKKKNRWTDVKVSVVGLLQRGGKVLAKIFDKPSFIGYKDWVSSHINCKISTLVTDKSIIYNNVE